MGKVQQRAGGGLAQADKAKLVPGNIRAGVTLFAGTAHETTGTLGLQIIEVGSYNGNKTIDLNTLLAEHELGADDVTADSFFLKNISLKNADASGYQDNGNHSAVARGCTMRWTYAAGVLTITGAAQQVASRIKTVSQPINYTVVLVALS